MRGVDLVVGIDVLLLSEQYISLEYLICEMTKHISICYTSYTIHSEVDDAFCQDLQF